MASVSGFTDRCEPDSLQKRSTLIDTTDIGTDRTWHQLFGRQAMRDGGRSGLPST